MKRFLRSKLTLSLVAMLVIAAAIIIPFSGSILPSHAASPAPSGKLWATGHDADLHCSNGNQQCNYFKVAVSYAMNNSKLPLLALDHGSEVAIAISDAFTSNAPTVKTVDPRTGFASLPLLSSSGNPLYSAIVVASDVTCGGCDNNDSVGVTPDSDAINARASDIAKFFNAGGGIVAFAGAYNFSVFYNFLPVAVSATTVSPSDGSPGGFALTSLGQSLGLTNTDINCCQTHNSFKLPPSGSSLQVAETDIAGNAETLVTNSIQRGKLFVFIQGIDTSLSKRDAQSGIIPTPGSASTNQTFGRTGGIYDTLKAKYPNASFLMYSYNRFEASGNPVVYYCFDTYISSIQSDVTRLAGQIKAALQNKPNTDVYLIGHSMGGLVAMSFLTYLVEYSNLKNDLFNIPGVRLKGVITLDSPLGGLDPGPNNLFENKAKDQYISVCPLTGTFTPFRSLQNIMNIFSNSPKRAVPYGGMDSIPSTLYGLSGNNESIAVRAAKSGISVLTIGNILDFLYNGAKCIPILRRVNYDVTLSSQWLADKGAGSGVYARYITAGTSTCSGLSNIAENHTQVFVNSHVKTAILQVINGNTPSALPIPYGIS